jgi:hypothetical protein
MPDIDYGEMPLYWDLVSELMRARQEIQFHATGLAEREVMRIAQHHGTVRGALDSPAAYGD